jgi:hypothetical protein
MEYLISPEAVAFAVYIFFFLVSAIEGFTQLPV